MGRSDDIYSLPKDLPVPEDDGAASHLTGSDLPQLGLAASDGRCVDLSALPGRVVVYCYPRTGRPDQALLPGWDDIPGARGCTPQSCAFRDSHDQLRATGVSVYGLSTQTGEDQREAAERLHLPYPLLSDSEFQLCSALRLPWFETAGMRLLKRLTWVARDGCIERVFYPVFPPDRNAAEVLAWLRLG